jgi:hypothetical protein
MGRESISGSQFSEYARQMFEQALVEKQAEFAMKPIASTTHYGGQEQVAAVVPGQQRSGPSEGIV